MNRLALLAAGACAVGLTACGSPADPRPSVSPLPTAATSAASPSGSAATAPQTGTSAVPSPTGPTAAATTTASAPATAAPSTGETTIALPSTPPPTEPVTTGVVTQTISTDPHASASDRPPASEFEEWRQSVLLDGGSVVTGDGCTLALPAALRPTAPGTRCDPQVTLSWADASGASLSAPVTFTTRRAGQADACTLARASGGPVTPLVAAENNGVTGCRVATTGRLALYLDDRRGGAVRSVELRHPSTADAATQDGFGQAETALTYTVRFATSPGRWSGNLPDGTITRRAG